MIFIKMVKQVNSTFKDSKRMKMLISIFTMIIIALIVGNNLLERFNYNQSLNYIKNKQWDKAIANFEKDKYYRDSLQLLYYVKANKILQETDKKLLGENQYKPVLDILEEIYSPYNGDLSTEISNFKSSINGMKNDYNEKVRLQRLQDFKEKTCLLMKQSKFKELFYSEEMHHLSNEFRNDKEIDILMKYAYILKKMQENPSAYKTNEDKIKDFENLLAQIPMDYNGLMSNEINEFKLSLRSKEEWVRKTKEINDYNEKIQKELSKPNPAIGMTANQLRESKWGKPDHINRTTTLYGTSEQWVYYGNRYVYLENGNVTSIQE